MPSTMGGCEGASGMRGDSGCGLETSTKEPSTSKSQLKLSRNPSRSVVSEGEKRSAEGGNGAESVGGNRDERAGSNAYSNSEKGTGGEGGDMVARDSEVGQPAESAGGRPSCRGPKALSALGEHAGRAGRTNKDKCR